MNRISIALVGLLSAYVPFALADTNESKPGEAAGLTALCVSFAAIAYAGNKWRLWWFGFQIGDASGSEFVGALKWSVIGGVVVAASFWIAAQFK